MQLHGIVKGIHKINFLIISGVVWWCDGAELTTISITVGQGPIAGLTTISITVEQGHDAFAVGRGGVV